MSISPIDAGRDAIAHTRRHLFPFRFETWLVLGVLAFLDQCGRSSWSSGSHWSSGGSDDSPAGPFEATFPRAVESALAWLSEHVALVVAVTLIGFAVVAAVVALIVWINARGTFMYLDAVASGRAEIRRPWREHAAAADSYFVWRFGIVLTGLLIVLMVGVLGAATVVALVRARPDWWTGGTLALALAPVVLVMLVALPLLVLAGVALRDFVAPLQLATGSSCGQALQAFERLLVAQPGAFVLYLLLKIVLVVVTATVVVVGGCLTCCVGFLPVVCQTLFQPLFFFERAWPLFLLRQMGHDVPARWSPAGVVPGGAEGER